MNKELYDSFKKLGETARAEIKFRLKDSPVGLALFDFLEKCSNRNFRNRDVVQVIYKEELQDTAYSVLENRYFKLRKKFTTEYFNVSENSEEVLAEQEKVLLHCKKLVSRNDKEKAYRELALLESECWQKNIFELLPSVIDQMIFCNQSVNRLERNNELYERLEESNNLLYDLTRCNLLARKVYEINYRKGIKHAKKEMAEMKDLAAKNKSYPRFIMCYHHISLYYKLGSTDYINDMQVISRHYSQYRALNGKYALMPLLGYRAHYNLYQHFHFKQISVFYHFNRCEFEEAYHAMKELWELAHSENDVYRIYRSESIYFNMFSAQCAAGRFTEAERTVEAYIGFLKENNNTQKIQFAYVLKAMLYCDVFPKTSGQDADFLLSKTEDYIRSMKGNNNVQTSLEEALLIKAKLHFTRKELKLAYETVLEEPVKKYLQSFDLSDLFEELFDPCAYSPAELKRKIIRRKYQAKIPQALANLRWLERNLDRK